MAQYKVPQDIEADDKLLGPFTFRQFVYLLVTAALVGILIFLFQLFPLLALIPVPFILLFGALALPIKKDQPMETYLAAIISYYIKPRTRTWVPGQRETVIKITAPKIVEDKKVREISSEEATHRLSFLADIVDTQGQSVNAFNNSVMRDDLVAEAQSTADMFDHTQFANINIAMQKDTQNRHDELMKMMRNAIAENEAFQKVEIKPATKNTVMPNRPAVQPTTTQPTMVQPTVAPQQPVAAPAPTPVPKPEQDEDRSVFKIPKVLDSPVVILPEKVDSRKNVSQNQPKSDIIETIDNSNNSAVAQQQETINERKDNGEVFVSLH